MQRNGFRVMGEFEGRRERLAAWMQAQGVNQSELARRLGIQPSYISCILRTAGRQRGIGEGLARRIEQVLGMPALALDGVEQGAAATESAPNDSAVDWRTLALVVADRGGDAKQRELLLQFCAQVDAESARLGRLLKG